MDHAKVSQAIKEGFDNNDLFELPEGFELSINMAGCLQLFAEIGGVRCWIYATPFYEDAEGIALSVETARAVGETDSGPHIDVRDELDAPHLRQIMELSEEREGLNESDKHDLAYLWFRAVAPKANALKELLS